MMLSRELTCGILGGLGPEATLNLMHQIMKKTSGAKTDQDHIHLVVEMNPKVPDRNKSLNGTGEQCGPILKQMAKNLVKAKADFVILACNTAHAYREMI